MKIGFTFSITKFVVALILAFIFFVSSLLFLRGCGIDVPCPQPEATFFRIVAGICTAYVVVIVGVKLFTKRKPA